MASPSLKLTPSTVNSTAVPLCFVADQDGGARRSIVALIGALGLKVKSFGTIAELLEDMVWHTPDVVFLDFGVSPADGPNILRRLAAAKINCPIQMMTALNPVLAERIRRDGERQHLCMLPVLYKPFRQNAVTHIIETLGMRRDILGGQKISLQDVLKNNWLELWYQPKIDLRSKCLVGAEVFVRARHPRHGPLPPECFLNTAPEAEILQLTAHVLVKAFEDWPQFTSVCPRIKIAFNIPFSALTKLSLHELMKEMKPRATNWAIFEITEHEVVTALSEAQELARELKEVGVGVAVGNCGSDYAMLARLKQPPFCELKIDRSYVAGCHLDPVTAGLCETMIDLAHKFGLPAVAEGIETISDLRALMRMNCDLGQGYLFARPMPLNEFIANVEGKKRTALAKVSVRPVASPSIVGGD